MKPLIPSLVLLVCSSPLFAQTTPVPPPTACGDLHVKMNVSYDPSQHAIQPPGAGQARLYIIQDSGYSAIGPYPTTRIGIDGKWVAANNKNSYVSISLAPGEHHLCVATQSHQVRNHIELTDLTAEAGKVYFLRSRIFYSQYGPDYLTVEPVNTDEATYLIQSYPLATSSPKK